MNQNKNPLNPFNINNNNNNNNNNDRHDNSRVTNDYYLKEEIIEIFENQQWTARKGWQPSIKKRPPWSNNEGFTLYPLDEASLKRGWVWLSDWEIEVRRFGKIGKIIGDGDINPKIKESKYMNLRTIVSNFGTYDVNGWEYATKFKRFGPNRIPRGLMKWNDRARRRKWVRKKALESIVEEKKEGDEIEKIQESLFKIQKIRLKINSIIQKDINLRDRAALRDDKSKLRQLIRYFNQRLDEIENWIQNETIQMSVKKKLLKDLEKEKTLLNNLLKNIDLGMDSIDINERESKSNDRISIDNNNNVPNYINNLKELNQVQINDDEDAEGFWRDDEDQMLMQQMIEKNEEEINYEILKEREEEMLSINQSMHEVNALFKDLALYVGEQDELINEIVENVDETHNNAEKGLHELEEAARIQKNTMCIIS